MLWSDDYWVRVLASLSVLRHKLVFDSKSAQWLIAVKASGAPGRHLIMCITRDIMAGHLVMNLTKLKSTCAWCISSRKYKRYIVSFDYLSHTSNNLTWRYISIYIYINLCKVQHCTKHHVMHIHRVFHRKLYTHHLTQQNQSPKESQESNRLGLHSLPPPTSSANDVYNKHV